MPQSSNEDRRTTRQIGFFELGGRSGWNLRRRQPVASPNENKTEANGVSDSSTPPHRKPEKMVDSVLWRTAVGGLLVTAAWFLFVIF